MASDEAYVTLATNDSYGLGALVLGYSLRQSGTSRQLAILITPGVTQSMRNRLSTVFDLVKLVDVLDSQDAANLALLARPELGITLTKIHAWNLVQYKKAVFLDADTLVLQNVDDLFQREELSAVPDVGWPDCFNTGVFVYRPSAQTYTSLIQFAIETGSFDGGDQGLLNSYFNDWATKDIKTHLPFIYNMVATVIYSYAPAFKQFGQDVKIVHFLGSVKPWHQTSASSSSAVLGQFLHLWWNIFNAHVRGGLEPGLAGLAGNIAQMSLGVDFGVSHAHVESHRQASHRRDWESGNIDYMGSDSFDNIQRRIQESIGSTPASALRKEPSPPRTGQQQQQQQHTASGQASQAHSGQYQSHQQQQSHQVHSVQQQSHHIATGLNAQASGDAWAAASSVSVPLQSQAGQQRPSPLPQAAQARGQAPRQGESSAAHSQHQQQQSAPLRQEAPSSSQQAPSQQQAKQPSPPPTQQPLSQQQQQQSVPLRQEVSPSSQQAPSQQQAKQPSPPPTQHPQSQHQQQQSAPLRQVALPSSQQAPSQQHVKQPSPPPIQQQQSQKPVQQGKQPTPPPQTAAQTAAQTGKAPAPQQQKK